jgi:hypothetical protein
MPLFRLRRHAPGDRVRRATRRYRELAQASDGSSREPLTIGCWVVSSADIEDLAKPPLALAVVDKGPDYQHVDGHAVSEVWWLSDGSCHPVHALTRVDLESILAEGEGLVAELRRAGPSDDRDATAVRVHRAACLARACDATKYEQRQLLFRLIVVDHEISDAEVAWRDCTTRTLPNLVKNLRDAGALWLAREPGWTPGDASSPHPNWRDK